MLRKVDRLTWIVATMSVLLALECVCGDDETTTRRVRHQGSSRGGSSISSEEQTRLERKFSENANLIHNAEWICGEPKPRLVYFDEAIEAVPEIPPHSGWLVQATVMHRCEAALGCCTLPKQCKPVEKEIKKVTFKSVHMGTGAPTYYEIPFYNHTSCACTDT